MTREEARQIIASWLVSSKGEKGQCGYIEGWFYEKDVEAFRIAIEALSAEAVQEWIPVSVRLPEDGIAVLITTENEEVYIDQVITDPYKERYFQSNTGYDNFQVIAWQPLPEPYKEEKNSDL